MADGPGPLDLLTFGEALVEVMRPGVGQPLHVPGTFDGPFPSGAPFIFTVQAARLGARAGCIGAVGDDAFGRCLLDQLEADHVETAGVQVLKTHTTGVAFVAYASDGSRDFVFHLRDAAAGQLAPALLDDPRTASLLGGLRCLHLMGSALSMHDDALALGHRLLDRAVQQGARISFDPNFRPQLIERERACEVFAPFVRAADVLLPTADELDLVASDAAPKPGRIVVIKRGAQGCTVLADGSERHVPGFRVVETDPTGAGDCFDAGFLVRWLSGDSVDQAARFANACGALAVTARGPMAGAQTSDRIQRFIEAAERSEGN